MDNNIILTTQVNHFFKNNASKGKLWLTKKTLKFEPFDKDAEFVDESVSRIVQTGFRKHLQCIPYLFYVKTRSGKVIYFKTPKAKKIVHKIEALIY